MVSLISNLQRCSSETGNLATLALRRWIDPCTAIAMLSLLIATHYLLHCLIHPGSCYSQSSRRAAPGRTAKGKQLLPFTRSQSIGRREYAAFSNAPNGLLRSTVCRYSLVLAVRRRHVAFCRYDFELLPCSRVPRSPHSKVLLSEKHFCGRDRSRCLLRACSG